MKAAADPLLRFRPEFPILERKTYLISNSLGAMPRAAAAALQDYAQTWASRGVRAWSETWGELSATAGDELAPRLSPHFYTEEAEQDRTFQVIDEIRESGAWRRWQSTPVLVT
ncbi:MAG: hypothetical protein H7X85_11365 [Thermoanaerobaculia bacterium]|nr:hypothetical protein [Thermoanaerobaculia bacterium]